MEGTDSPLTVIWMLTPLDTCKSKYSRIDARKVYLVLDGTRSRPVNVCSGALIGTFWLFTWRVRPCFARGLDDFHRIRLQRSAIVPIVVLALLHYTSITRSMHCGKIRLALLVLLLVENLVCRVRVLLVEMQRMFLRNNLKVRKEIPSFDLRPAWSPSSFSSSSDISWSYSSIAFINNFILAI